MTAPEVPPDVVVVGGGPAGSAAAIHLASAGVRVTLLERTRAAHDVVCGEFLSAGAQAHLAALGVAVAPPLGAPIRRLRLIRGTQEVEARLPFTALGLSRRVLDERLLERARAVGVTVRRGVTVRAVEPGAAVLADGSRVTAGAVFLATGKHDLRSHRRPAGIHPGLVGLKMRLDGGGDRRERRDGGAIDLLLFDGGYAGHQPVGAGQATVCLLVTADRWRRLGASWPRLMADLARTSPRWRDRLGAARPLWQRPLAVAGQPYGFQAAGGDADGPLYRIGDQVAVVPSFCGEGIALALHSARLAADCFLAHGADTAPYYAAAAEAFGRVRPAAWASRALEQPAVQAAAVQAAALAPRLLTVLARSTRLA